MYSKIQVHLFGATGERTTEVSTRGGFPTRHIHAPRETAPVSEKTSVCSEPPTPSGAPVDTETKPEPVHEDSPESPILIVMQQMHKTMSGWLILDEILYVATAQFGMTVSHDSLRDALRPLYRERKVEHQKNRFGQDCFQLPSEKPPNLKMLLVEVDAVMSEGGAA